MSFTSDDLAAINAAILALGTGSRVEEVRFADGRTVKYTAAQLSDIITVRDLIRSDLSASAGVTDPTRIVGGVTLAEWSR